MPGMLNSNPLLSIKVISMGEERIKRGFKGTKLQLNRRNKF
jgi:hypothetical protein